MRIIGPLDQKPFFGVAIAVVSGLMLGGSMKPDLNETALARAPQLQSPVSADRVEFIDSRSGANTYRYGLPDWVIGTDALRPAYPEPEPMAEAEPAYEYEVAAYEPPEPPPASEPAEPLIDQAPAATHTYPSLGGGVLLGTGAPTPEAGEAEPAEPLAG